MISSEPTFRPLDGASFGVEMTFDDGTSATALDTFIAAADEIRARFKTAGGLMVVKGLTALEKAPERFVQISETFGSEVENYHETPTATRFRHNTIPQVLILSNLPPCNHPPPPCPEPRLTDSGGLVVQFPQQQNWHTDQSFRRPPPDITLLYGVTTPPRDQGQTLYADCTAAYAALDRKTRARIQGLQGIHVAGWTGRTPDDVRQGVTPLDLPPHQAPQRHPLVRFHPDSGKPALYVCEERQMDFVAGPIEGLGAGPDGEGATLLRALLRHATRPEFTYVHEWSPGDLVIGDNRCLLHAATWYDAERHARLMWRTTVMGNPGEEYSGDTKSWIPPAGFEPTHGMEKA